MFSCDGSRMVAGSTSLGLLVVDRVDRQRGVETDVDIAVPDERELVLPEQREQIVFVAALPHLRDDLHQRNDLLALDAARELQLAQPILIEDPRQRVDALFRLGHDGVAVPQDLRVRDLEQQFVGLGPDRRERCLQDLERLQVRRIVLEIQELRANRPGQQPQHFLDRRDVHAADRTEHRRVGLVWRAMSRRQNTGFTELCHVLVPASADADDHVLVRRPSSARRIHPRDGVRRFQRRNDSFESAEQRESRDRFIIGHRDVLRSSAVLPPRVFWSNPRIIESCRNAVRRVHLPMLVLQQVAQ